MTLDFRSKVLLIKCLLNISDSPLSSETMKSFPEIIILLARMSLSEKDLMVLIIDSLDACQKYFLPDASFEFTFEK